MLGRMSDPPSPTGADVVVVGAGVIGAAVALELAKQGRSVVVVDKAGGPGQGSTSASSAVVRFNYSTWDGVATSWEAKHCWQAWADHLGGGAEPLARFRRTGFVMLDVPVADSARTTALFDRAGIPYELWDVETVQRRVPGIDPTRHWPPKPVTDEAFWTDGDGELGALWCPDGGFVDDPQLAAVNLADAAARAGARLVLHRRVVDVPRHGDRVAGVVLDDGARIDAPVVVNVAGPWSTALNRLAGVGDDFTIAVRPMRQEVHHVPAPPGYNPGTDLGPVVADIDLGTYMRATPGDGLLVGGTEPECDPFQWVDDPDSASPHPTQAVYDAQTVRAARRFPELRVPTAMSGIAGVYDVAQDWTPIYDRTSLPGFYVAMGTSGNQFKNAPVAGRFLAMLVDRVEAGHDHDGDPLTYVGEHTGLAIDLGAFSRRRAINAESSGTVMG
jgi:glycine/D-amino acid oxidase-like deaminating enzyme